MLMIGGSSMPNQVIVGAPLEVLASAAAAAAHIAMAESMTSADAARRSYDAVMMAAKLATKPLTMVQVQMTPRESTDRICAEVEQSLFMMERSSVDRGFRWSFS